MGLTNWDYFVRFHSTILRDDIKHFAYNGEQSNSPFEDERTVTRIRAAIRQVVEDQQRVKNLTAVVREDQEQKRAFLVGARKSRRETEADLEELRREWRNPPF